MKVCSICGSTYDDHIDFCFKDGQPLAVVEAVPAAEAGQAAGASASSGDLDIDQLDVPEPQNLLAADVPEPGLVGQRPEPVAAGPPEPAAAEAFEPPRAPESTPLPAVDDPSVTPLPEPPPELVQPPELTAPPELQEPKPQTHPVQSEPVSSAPSNFIADPIASFSDESPQPTPLFDDDSDIGFPDDEPDEDIAFAAPAARKDPLPMILGGAAVLVLLLGIAFGVTRLGGDDPEPANTTAEVRSPATGAGTAPVAAEPRKPEKPAVPESTAAAAVGGELGEEGGAVAGVAEGADGSEAGAGEATADPTAPETTPADAAASGQPTASTGTASTGTAPAATSAAPRKPPATTTPTSTGSGSASSTAPAKSTATAPPSSSSGSGTEAASSGGMSGTGTAATGSGGEPWEAPDAATEGSVLITSQPDAATVSVDGAKMGHTPLTVPLAYGTHRISVQLDGFDSVTRDVSVGSPQLNVPFELAASTRLGAVTLYVPNNLSGAKVFIDGKPGGVIPVTVQLAEGPHTFRVVTDESHFSVEKQVTFDTSGRPVHLFLEPN